ncbi:MAG: molecular chaperone [Pyrinomonadaceae bacterium]
MELFRALAVIAEPPREEAARVAEALGLGALASPEEYTETFVFQLYPYASVYLGPEGMLGGEARDRVAGFWRALELSPPAEVDHLAVMLALYARLCELEAGAKDTRARAGWHAARKAYLWEHLLSWLPAYLSKLDETGTPFYRRWGALLSDALAAEASAVGRQESLPLALREAPGLSDPRAGSTEDFLRSLVAPARGGMVLVRADFSRAARELGAGTRLGERRFMLQTLFEQDARATLGWLAAEAARWAGRHERGRETFGGVARAWAAKAEAAARLLHELEQTTDAKPEDARI